MNFEIKKVSGKTNIFIGEVHYDLTEIELDSLTLPSFTITPIPNVGLDLKITGSSSHVHFKWHYSTWQIQFQKKFHFFIFSFFPPFRFASDSGTGDVYISNTDINADIKIVNMAGRAHLNTEGASVNIGGFKLDLHGGASWLYDLFLG